MGSVQIANNMLLAPSAGSTEITGGLGVVTVSNYQAVSGCTIYLVPSAAFPSSNGAIDLAATGVVQITSSGNITCGAGTYGLFTVYTSGISSPSHGAYYAGGTATVTAAPTLLTAAGFTLAAPVNGANSTAASAPGIGYTITSTTWSHSLAVGSPFAESTAYYATVVLTSSAGYAFGDPVSPAGVNVTGIGSGSVVGATTGGGSGTGNTLTVLVSFPATDATPAIHFTTQPKASTTVVYRNINDILSVNAVATPSATVTYQWYMSDNGSPYNTIGSATTDGTLTIPSDLAIGTYYFHCVASSTGAANVQSNTATVHVVTPSLISTPPPVITNPSRDISFTFNGLFSDFGSIALNGVELVQDSNTPIGLTGYPSGSTVAVGSVEQGSTVITINGAFLATLKDGKYTIEVVFADSSSPYALLSASFTINRGGAGGGAGEGGAGRGTGDFTDLAGLWLTLILSALVVGYYIWQKRRQINSQIRL